MSIHRAILEAMLAEARRNPGIECCGLLAGRGGEITHILPAANRLASATAYDVAPQDLFHLFRQMRDAGLDHLGVYHSHPSGDNAPSPRDIEQAYYPEAAYFILSPLPDASRPVRAFQIGDGAAIELK
ncbi:MAG TPA: M67 family metallopeptidase, partial [Candidatus Acidoferrales bacterium]